MPLLTVSDLSVEFPKPGNPATVALNGVSFQIDAQTCLGLVGESGSGKSMTALSIMRLLPPTAMMTSGSIIWHGADSPVKMETLVEPELRKIRGAEISMIFQEPMTSLNPVFRCGFQVDETLLAHHFGSRKAARERTLELFDRVRLADPARIYQSFPHEISGGQKQRVMIAMALACQPKMLIADEPTTALDVTVQKTILDLLNELRDEFGLAMLFISHDLGVISEIADRVAVMHHGIIVEEGPVNQILAHPEHPYTQGLMACRPSIHKKVERLPTIQDFLSKEINAQNLSKAVTLGDIELRRGAIYQQNPILQVNNLSVQYPSRKNWIGSTVQWQDAVQDISFDVYPGETFGIAGESGCGKTTLGRTLARLKEAHQGSVLFQGVNLLKLKNRELKPFRREIQMIFQDPYASLNPRMTIGKAISEPLEVHQIETSESRRRERVIDLLEKVGLEATHYNRYPHEFSGGQRQRICIARALTLNPKLLICDEIVSALDVSVQAQVLNLLADLQDSFHLAYIFISHDLSVLNQICDRIMVMRNGKIEALGFPEKLLHHPDQPYIRELIAAVVGG